MEIRTFALFLQALEDGRLHADLTEKLNDLVGDLSNYVLNYGGVPEATISLKFKVKLTKGVFEVMPAIEFKTPTAPRDRTILWATPDNNLTQANPRQQEMFERRGRPAAVAEEGTA